MSEGACKLDHSAWPPVGEDPLTGLPNLFAFLSDFKNLAGMPATVLGFDLEGLTLVNSTQGRSAGDAKILEFSECLWRETTSFQGARCYRLGGDEFCVSLPGDSADAPNRFVQSMKEDPRCPAFTHSVALSDRDAATRTDALISVWAWLQGAPGPGAGPANDPVRGVTRRLVAGLSEAVELLEDARKLAYTDDISGLPNQRAVSYRMRTYLSGEVGGSLPLSILFVDGDNLRKYNDELGYEAGNEMIRRLGKALVDASLPGEMVSRWLSGDEFMIVMPGTDNQKAHSRASSICAAVKEASSHWPFPVTVSIGVVTAPDSGLEYRSLVTLAEKANNIAKKRGKNRVCGPDEAV